MPKIAARRRVWAASSVFFGAEKRGLGSTEISSIAALALAIASSARDGPDVTLKYIRTRNERKPSKIGV